MSAHANAPVAARFGLALGHPALSAFARLLAGVVPLVAIFALIEPAFMATCRLPAASYFEPVIAFSLPRALAIRWPLLLALAALLCWRRREVWRGWGELEQGQALRLLVGGLTLVFAWTFATNDVNLYFDRTHAVDRLLLVVLAALVCWRPLFLLGFLPLLAAVVWQFEVPLGGFSWTDKSAPVRVLLLFLVWFLWLAATGGRRTQAFVFTMGCLVAGHYFVPALEKLRLGWLAHGQLHHLTLAAWENGWLVGLDAAGITSLAKLLSRGEPLSMAFTIAVEAGALFFFWRRSAALALLAGWILLHTGIFFTSGIFFWKWMLRDAGLFAFFLALRRAPATQVFGPGPLLLSFVLVAGASTWCTPVRLGWFDTRIAYTYRYTAFTASGGAYRIAPSFFAPYDLLISQNRFGYLVERPSLVGTFGMTLDGDIAAALIPVRALPEVETLETRMGRALFDAKRAEHFDDFMRRFLSAANRRGAHSAWYTVLRPPLHIWTAPREPAYALQEPIVRLGVDRVTTLWDGERFTELRVERVREVAIPTGASAAAGLPAPEGA
jgi:hypothetical protein